jgi:hypothetical protein
MESDALKRALHARRSAPSSAFIVQEASATKQMRWEVMSMPYVSSQNIRIHYQVEGDGPPLVLQHGSMSSLETWRQCGYVQALQHAYQCILLDARGRGGSDKPHDSTAYALRCYVVSAELLSQGIFL